MLLRAALHDFRLPLDEPIYHAVNDGFGWRWLDALFVLVSTRQFGAAVAVVLGVWLFSALGKRAFRPALQAAIAGVITDKVGHELLKPWAGRMRPCYALAKGTFRQLADVANSGSMPSLHSATAFAVAMSIFLVWPFAGRLVFPIAALIAISRIAVGVHWPSDVLAGALFGSLVALAVHAVGNQIAKRRRPPPAPSEQPVA